MPRVGFEPTVSAGERPKTYALDRAATGTGIVDIMWKYIVEPDKPQITVRRMRISSWITKATNTHKHTHTHMLCNNYCFFTVTMVARARLNVTLYVHCLSFLE